MSSKLIISALLLWAAEVLGSWWVWNAAPTDTLRVWYPDFWRFELGRLPYWALVFTPSVLVWLIGWHRLHHRVRAMLLSVGLALAVEFLTSAWYWRSASSAHTRGLYESIWYWHRVPQPHDKGWPSFWGYLCTHVVPWAVFLVLALAASYGLSRVAGHLRRKALYA